MHVGRTVFSQLMDLFPLVEFRRCVERYRGNHKIQHFSCLDQFLCLAFAQLTSRESLRDIEVCLRAVQPRLYHMGFRGNISRNTLANANLKRDWRIYAAVAQILIRQARQLYSHENLGLELEQTAYALDSTTIDLCLSLFPWAPFQRTKAAIKRQHLADTRQIGTEALSPRKIAGSCLTTANGIAKALNLARAICPSCRAFAFVEPSQWGGASYSCGHFSRYSAAA